MSEIKANQPPINPPHTGEEMKPYLREVKLRSLASSPCSASLIEIAAEVDRATAKFPTWPTDPLHAVGVLNEEVGELNKEVLQMTYEPHKSSREAIRSEAIQTAAMALRFVMSLDAYAYTPRDQHSQQNAK